MDEFRAYKPEACRHCGEPLIGDDPQPRRWQVTEIPPVRPVVTEHQVHMLTCRCGKTTTATDLLGAPAPHLSALSTA